MNWDASIICKEKFDAAARDAGSLALQTWIHGIVRWGIVWSYTLMVVYIEGRQS